MTAQKKNIVYPLILLAYTVLPFVVLNFRALDSGGPRFLALAILNILSFTFVIIFEKKSDSEKDSLLFPNTWIGFFYFLFMGFALLSFSNSINLGESLIYWTKLFSVFAAIHVLFVIIRSNHNYIQWLAVSLSILLLIDSAAVLHGIVKYISREIEAVSEIVFIYSNKNILASAIFIKLAAAIWLFFFSKSWSRILGYLAAFLGMLTTFLLSTRSFYIGLIAILACLILFVVLRQIKGQGKVFLRPLLAYFMLLLISLGSFTLIQKNLFPDEQDVLNKDVVTRISTIADSQANHARLDSWGRTIKLIGENPILGVGSGNWKLRVLKYENPTLPDFKYMYRNHNDFLEIFAETGLLGGISYLAVFILILFGFLKASLYPQIDPEKLKFLAFPALGIIAYSIDAFFNFPASRVELQLLFVFMISGAAALAPERVRAKWMNHQRQIAYLAVLGVFSLASLFLLFGNYTSLRTQRMVKEETLLNQYSKKTAVRVASYPKIPNINAVGGPISIDKARYLIDEQKLNEAKQVLLLDQSSPYDYRKDYYLGMILAQEGKIDSALIVMDRFNNNKPLFQPGIDLYGTILYQASRSAYESRDYSKTLEITAKLLKIRPDYIQINPIRAYCYFYTQDYMNCIQLIDVMIDTGIATQDLVAIKTECQTLLEK